MILSNSPPKDLPPAEDPLNTALRMAFAAGRAVAFQEARDVVQGLSKADALAELRRRSWQAVGRAFDVEEA